MHCMAVNVFRVTTNLKPYCWNLNPGIIEEFPNEISRP
jgi:hypothetical protein